MALQGHVRTISLLEIFQFLADNLYTGMLTVTSGEQQRTVYFRDGHIHVTRSAATAAGRIGDLLVKRGKVGLAAVQECLELQRDTGTLLGELLVQRGHADQATIDEGLRLQYEEGIYPIFIWPDASFTFVKGRAASELTDEDAFELNAGSILMEAARRKDEWARLMDRIPSERSVVRLRPDALPRIQEKLTARHFDLDPSLLDANLSVAQIFERSGEPQFPTAEMLCELLEEETIEPLPLGEVEGLFRTALREGDFPFAVNLLGHAADAGLPLERLRDLENTLLRNRAFVRSSDRLTYPVLREGPALVEFLQSVFRNMLTGAFHVRAGSAEKWIVFERGRILIDAAGRDVLDLERRLESDTRISPIDVKKVLQQREKADQPINEVLTRSGVLSHHDLRRLLLDLAYREIHELALLDRPIVVFRKGASAFDVGLGNNALVLETAVDNLHFEMVDALSSWVRASSAIPLLDVVLTEAELGAAASSDVPVLALVNGRASVREILARSRRAPVDTFEQLLEALGAGLIRPLSESEVGDTVQFLLGAERVADALRLCRCAQRIGMDPDTFSEVERAILEEHGDPTTTEQEYRLAGDLLDFSLAEVLQSLHTNQKSGTLRIADVANERDIFFEKGAVFYVRVEDEAKSTFGTSFLGMDLLDTAEGLFGEAEMPRGVVSEDEVAEEVAEQIKEEIFDTFLWEDARFEFIANQFPPEFHDPGDNMKMKLASDRFLMQAVNIITEWEAIQAAFSMRTIFTFISSEAKLQAVSELGTPEVLYLVDGRLNVRSIVRRSGFDKLKVCQILHGLLQQEWIRPLRLEELVEAAAAAIDKGDDPGALAYLEYARELDPTNEIVLEAVGEISQRTGAV